MYTSTGWGWTPATFGLSDLTGETVTGAQFLHNAIPSLRWAAIGDDIFVQYFHLTKGIDGYDQDAALTREQAAQLILNLFKATPDYNEAGIKANDGAMGLTLVRTTNDICLGRPSVQWFKGETPVSSVYADTPVAVIQGGVNMEKVITAAGVSKTMTDTLCNLGNVGYEGNKPGYVYAHSFVRTNWNGDGWTSYGLRYHGGSAGEVLGDHGYVIEIYDSYTIQSDGTFKARGYDVVYYWNYLAEVRDNALALWGEPDANYGWWTDGSPAANLSTLSNGFYVMVHNGHTRLVEDQTTVIEGVLTGVNMADYALTIGETDYKYSTVLRLGYNALNSADAIGKTYTFVLNQFGVVLGFRACEHTWSAWTDEGGNHSRHCTSCYLEQSGAHDVPENWTPVEGGTHHSKACSVCGGASETLEHTMSVWTLSNEDDTKCVRSCADCGYAESQDHVPGELVNFVAPEVGKPGYSGDRYCVHCNTQVVTGTVTTTTCTHTPGNPVKENVVEADCGVPGSYDEVVYCTVAACGEKLSSTHYDVAALEHSWKESGRTPATETEDGSVQYVCEHNAQHTKEEVLPATLSGKTDYPEAIEVLTATGMLNTDNTVWQKNINGAEANRILQALYDGPGFIDAWSAGLTADAEVTGTEFLTKIMTPLGYGGWTIELSQMIGYLHLLKGLPGDLDLSKPITREVAAQIALNGLKAIPEYDGDHIKANDGNIGLTLVKVSTDEMGRPSYKWQKNGQDVSAVYADEPLVALYGGDSWELLLNDVGLTSTFAGVGIHGWFRMSENGGNLSEYVLHYHGDPDGGKCKDQDWYLEIYDDYANYTGVYAGNGHTFKTHGYTVLALSGENIPDDAEQVERPSTAPSISHIDTDYPEAVQLMIAMGWMDTNADWKGDITGAEANKILEILYAGPGFANPWAPDFAANGKVTGAEFTSDALVTIGWNYGNDPLFTVFNHLEKGLKEDYSSSGSLSREETAQIVLNTLRTASGYYSDNY